MPHAYTNGIITFYEEAQPKGRPDALAVVLIHGSTVDLRLWDYQVPALVSAGFRVIRYDVRGHGRSMIPPSGYTWENYAADLGDLLNRLNIDRPRETLGLEAVHLVGLSMGGGIALQFALDFPQRVLSLALIDSALPGFTYSEEFGQQIEEMVRAVRSEGPRRAIERLWLPHPIFDGIRRFPDRFEFLQSMVLTYAAADFLDETAYRPPPRQVSDRLSEIHAPALVMVGERDLPDFRLTADLLAENLANARKLVLSDCGHIPPLEQPQAVNEVLISFLREISHR